MLNKLYQSKLYPLLFQIITLIVFVLLIIGGIGITAESSAFVKQLRNTNLSNLIVWSYWWPLIVLVAVLFGRHWCSICPIELISYIFERIGLKTKVPRLVKTAWLITIIYAFIAVVAIHTWGIHRVPHLMALYLLSLFAFAVLISIIYEKRAFCSYFCPVGKLLSLYALLSPLGIRVKSTDVCQNCKTKDCISKSNRHKLIARSCTSEVYPEKISDNRDCILCTQCVKACPNSNIELGKNVKPFSLFSYENFRWAEVAMIIILIGFVAYEVMGSWDYSKSVLLSFPRAIYVNMLQGILSYTLFEGIIVFLVMPLLVVLAISSIGVIAGRESFGYYIRKTTAYLLPIVAFGHLFKTLLKTTSRLPYWEYALEKPNGEYYASKILNNEIAIQQSSLLQLIVTILGILVLTVALYISAKKIIRDSSNSTFLKAYYIVIVAVYFFLLLIGPKSDF